MTIRTPARDAEMAADRPVAALPALQPGE